MYLYIMFLFLLLRLIIWILSNINWRAFKLNPFNRKIRNINSLFKNNFIDSKVLFATRFNALANISLIQQIDPSKAYALVMENFGNEITAVHQYNTFDYNEDKVLFNMTIFVLTNERIIELGYNYAEILYTGKDYNWANALLSDLANFRVTDRTKVIGFVNSEVMN
jgi:hypothetical protein